jgi:hypothetical protein
MANKSKKNTVSEHCENEALKKLFQNKVIYDKIPTSPLRYNPDDENYGIVELEEGIITFAPPFITEEGKKRCRKEELPGLSKRDIRDDAIMKKNLNKRNTQPLIDWELMKDQIGKGMTLEIVAKTHGYSLDQIKKRCRKELRLQFNDFVVLSEEASKTILKNAMWDRAINDGNVAMQIWLSKNILGYSDKVEQKVDVTQWNVQFGGMTQEAPIDITPLDE